MTGLAVGTQIWVAASHSDMRKGFAVLAGVAHSVLEQNSTSGHVFVFRRRTGCASRYFGMRAKVSVCFTSFWSAASSSGLWRNTVN